MAEPDANTSIAEASNEPAPQASTGRLLDGSVAPTSASNPTKARAPPKKKFGTLGDLSAGGSSHAGHGHSDDESDEDFVPDNPDMFAGGEKSGLAVQNPNSARDLQRQIIEKAKRYEDYRH